ncbi:MAG: mitofilin family membrane protein, partial [Paracoccaceae bacterium]|nr:mitofilin family membrane protein [Paracoccaceae bacterium]
EAPVTEKPPVAAHVSGGNWILPLAIGSVSGGAVAFAVSLLMTGPAAISVQDAEADANIAALQEQVGMAVSELATLKSDLRVVAEMSELQGSALSDTLDDLDKRVSALQDDLAATANARDALETVDSALRARITELEARPLPDTEAETKIIALYQQQLEKLRALVDERLAGIEAAQGKAEAAGAKAVAQISAARRQADLAALTDRISSGEPYEELLTVLLDQGLTIPPVLAENAESGIVGQDRLEQRFSERALPALEASIRADAAAGKIDRTTAFMRIQLGIRSLSPQDGDDPDAVLSRAEAFLGEGDLATALAELQNLPAEGQKVMEDWVLLAQNRQAALAALAALVDGIGK